MRDLLWVRIFLPNLQVLWRWSFSPDIQRGVRLFPPALYAMKDIFLFSVEGNFFALD